MQTGYGGLANWGMWGSSYAYNPSRWGNRDVRNCTPVGPTTLNPEKGTVKKVEKQAA